MTHQMTMWPCHPISATARHAWAEWEGLPINPDHEDPEINQPSSHLHLHSAEKITVVVLRDFSFWCPLTYFMRRPGRWDNACWIMMRISQSWHITLRTTVVPSIQTGSSPTLNFLSPPPTSLVCSDTLSPRCLTLVQLCLWILLP